MIDIKAALDAVETMRYRVSGHCPDFVIAQAGKELDLVRDTLESLSAQVEQPAGCVKVMTFEELVQYGIAHDGNIVNGMPWSFSINGVPVTHENDDCYVICGVGVTKHMHRGDLLIIATHGAVYPVRPI